MSFLDVKIIRKQGKFTTSVSRRPTLSEEFILILTVPYHPPKTLTCFMHCYIDVSGFALIGLSSYLIEMEGNSPRLLYVLYMNRT